ncbi:MAG: Hsp20/alpha crystallin family protein [Bifidobacterium merycicum]|uniref:Heat shock protein Hsp20 n=1 Tax=Bifidobacterium merycicum TaxID=78345 RepID=A0A087BD63_9BIFI|nr:Hsp20/alpha crystallin family protein [Bifidobacterium merycicum]MBQ1514035.1 Hsp20/alpha crystallin family protein [Bifidobacterium sp.]KFI68963.1 heat shock protein Hsp20 [Bifidobacterium merycicum]MEE1294501.1 Hsp20/alpha crystallin family protein [Bifidobacterium merycicum]MEE3341920.1 Hsp20/alpha crystallin family protein [Bifidobacterium merycicum]SHE74553.1 Molecular chaperone IbpA, HSP20 family [Bifidobacterium merycicum DSM 6492]
MAMFPALMNDTMFSDLFDDPFFEGWRNMENVGTRESNMSMGMMSTDVRESDKGYMVDIDMPGFKKEDISLELQNGYLTVSAHRDSSHDDKAEDGKWLRRERYVGSCSRSFYVGEDMKDSDIHASYKDGTLCLELPKPQAQQQVETKHRIAIEG